MSYDWKLPDTQGTIDIRIVPVDQPIFTKVTSLKVTASSSGVSATKLEPRIQVYPNPVAKMLHVSGVPGATVSLLDILGRTVLQTNLRGGDTMLDCSKLPVGNYLVRIGSEMRPVTIAR